MMALRRDGARGTVDDGSGSGTVLRIQRRAVPEQAVGIHARQADQAAGADRCNAVRIGPLCRNRAGIGDLNKAAIAGDETGQASGQASSACGAIRAGRDGQGAVMDYAIRNNERVGFDDAPDTETICVRAAGIDITEPANARDANGTAHPTDRTKTLREDARRIGQARRLERLDVRHSNGAAIAAIAAVATISAVSTIAAIAGGTGLPVAAIGWPRVERRDYTGCPS